MPDNTSTRPPARRRAAIAGLALLSGAAIVGCGSDDSNDRSGSKTFCASVEDYAEATRAGDKTGMASALEQGLDDVEDGSRRTVEAYIDALMAAPPNEQPEDDSVEKDSEEAFRAYAEETCGADALPADDSATPSTSTSAPASSTTEGGTTSSSTTGPGNASNEPDDPSGGGEGDVVDDNENYVPTEGIDE